MYVHVALGLLVQTVNGQGIDRHLLGLKLTALESGMNLPELFMDSSFQYAHHFKMSTSQVRISPPMYICFAHWTSPPRWMGV